MLSKFAVLLLASSLPLQAQNLEQVPAAQTLGARTATMTHLPGLLALDWEAATGKLFLEIPLDAKGQSRDLLFVHTLPSGVGSNDTGLDRGQLQPLSAPGDAGHIVHFERQGNKVLLVEPNQSFRSSSADAAEQLAVSQSFPSSVLAGFKVEAEGPASTILVDATDFFLRDLHGVAEALTGVHQGTYKVDPARSAIVLERTRSFPGNTEVEAILTFTTDDASTANFVRDVTPDPRALTVHEHASFLELPGPGFVSRRFDPRAGYFPTSYRDYSAPLGTELDQQFILRHRLNKKDPACRQSCIAEAPIQYYVDRGAPEPIRSALVEGARWWDQAFQAAGWAPGTFKVDVLPADLDPMDSRVNIIQWVHRYTRGWSYGAAIADPRTGEIIKGNVTLGSLRTRQDYLIAEALLAPYKTVDRHPSATASFYASPADDPALQMVLARIRQLAAHETGHTLGLAHNFAASSFSQSASVMDYPHPYITLDKLGIPDLTHAYAADIGVWDKVAIDYGYRQFPARSNEHAELDKIIAAAEKSGLVYITDEDARPQGGAHPHAHLWDNGAAPADELSRILTLRAAALARFGEDTIRPGTPVAQLEDTLVPLYLLHRYQTEAAIKEIGGLDYRYQLRPAAGQPGESNPVIVSPQEQRKALTAVLKTLSAETLTLPESLLAILPPRPPGLERTRESFATHTGLTFDPVTAAESAADLTLNVLFDPARASRLVEYHARNPANPSLVEVIDAALAAVHSAPHHAGERLPLDGIVLRSVYLRTVEALLTLAANPQASPIARAVTAARLHTLRQQADLTDPVGAAVAARITEFEQDPAKFVIAKPLEVPPGMPIGGDDGEL